ncbi:MAG: NAD-dependent epimerase/dehydratase family protein, partial [Pseudomonadota bacterium]|nr:NAD-dependent epimerase/dehydratase family protein [Pseudomonadota bacterium]
MRQALVFGASGQIGDALVRRLLDAGWQVVAVSRDTQVDAPGLRWLRGDLAHCEGLPRAVDAIFSCGPLDVFADWYASTMAMASPRVIAFGSTSAATKADSVEAGERGLAQRLRDAELKLHAAADARGAATVLRPTLVYGAGRDRSISRLAAAARRLGWLPVPRGADGMRQPVHVDDLAVAAIAACDAPAACGNDYDLPGGEALPWRAMVERTLATMAPPPRVLTLSAPLFALAVRCARMLGQGEG